jgi:hypothetical protein
LGGSTNNGLSNYNSLQAVFQKRVSYGLEFNFAYTWSKFLDSQDTSSWASGLPQPYQSSYCVKCNWGPSIYDMRHVLTFSGIYTLPFGRGAQFLNKNRIVDEIVGGWRLAATSRDNTGTPFTPMMGASLTYAQAGSQFPNQVGDPHQGGGSIANWFNKAAYASPGIATYGDVHRNSLYGPGYTNLNLSFGKTFTITEGTKFEVRADAQNALNHASFGGPDATVDNNKPAVISSVTDGGRHIQLYGRFSF